MSDGSKLGPYIIRRELQAGYCGQRWLAVHDRAQSTHVLHRIEGFTDRVDQRRLIRAFESLSPGQNPHRLEVSEFAFDHEGCALVITPYPGNQDGLTTLKTLLEAKGGQMELREVCRAARHLLQAVGDAQQAGLQHGPVLAQEVLIDRHGSLLIELYGFALTLGIKPAWSSAAPDACRDEIRSVVELSYFLLTGVKCEEPHIPVSSVLPRCEKSIERWLEHGLDPASGYTTAEEAIEALPGTIRNTELPERDAVSVRTVLGRVRSALWQQEL